MSTVRDIRALERPLTLEEVRIMRVARFGHLAAREKRAAPRGAEKPPPPPPETLPGDVELDALWGEFGL